jgi:N-acetyl-D-muramate 6-phosphate phosphatase
MKFIEAVFFDLDGTVLDTAPDLAAACNEVLREYQRPAIPLAEFREWVHGGAVMMICESFRINTAHPDFAAIKTAFLNHYQQQLTRQTRLFAGIDDVLRYLEQEKIPWGIVTNKPQWLTQPLMEHFGLSSRSCCTISGDTLATAKPHPAPLLHACELVHAAPSRSVYVGDTLGDIQAAHAAGMISIAVKYGYNPAHCDINAWPADNFAATPEHLLSIFSDPAIWRRSP